MSDYDMPDPGTYEPKGTRFIDLATNREMLLLSEPGHPNDGWICYRHPDGQWVTLRKATVDDLARINAAGRSTLPPPSPPETPARDDCGCDEGGLCERHRIEGHTCGEAGDYCDDEVHRALRCECGSAAWVAMDDRDTKTLALTCARCVRKPKRPRVAAPETPATEVSADARIRCGACGKLAEGECSCPKETPGYYHPDPSIDAEIRDEVKRRDEWDRAHGIRVGWHKRAASPASAPRETPAACPKCGHSSTAHGAYSCWIKGCECGMHVAPSERETRGTERCDLCDASRAAHTFIAHAFVPPPAVQGAETGKEPTT